MVYKIFTPRRHSHSFFGLCFSVSNHCLIISLFELLLWLTYSFFFVKLHNVDPLLYILHSCMQYTIQHIKMIKISERKNRWWGWRSIYNSSRSGVCIAKVCVVNKEKLTLITTLHNYFPLYLLLIIIWEKKNEKEEGKEEQHKNSFKLLLL